MLQMELYPLFFYCGPTMKVYFVYCSYSALYAWKHFDQELRQLHMTYYHTYPKTSKMNAHLERFNRIIQKESIRLFKTNFLRFNL